MKKKTIFVQKLIIMLERISSECIYSDWSRGEWNYDSIHFWFFFCLAQNETSENMRKNNNQFHFLLSNFMCFYAMFHQQSSTIALLCLSTKNRLKFTEKKTVLFGLRWSINFLLSWFDFSLQFVWKSTKCVRQTFPLWFEIGCRRSCFTTIHNSLVELRFGIQLFIWEFLWIVVHSYLVWFDLKKKLQIFC